MGNGMATKRIRPNASNFSTSLAFFLVLSNSQSKNFSNIFMCLSLFAIGCSKNKRGMTGIRLPITARIYALRGGKPIANENGIAPLSSETGSAATTITASSLLQPAIVFVMLSNIPDNIYSSFQPSLPTSGTKTQPHISEVCTPSGFFSMTVRTWLYRPPLGITSLPPTSSCSMYA